MAPSVWGLGYDEELLRFVLTQTSDYLTMGISVEDQPHQELLERCGFREVERSETLVNMRYNVSKRGRD